MPPIAVKKLQCECGSTFFFPVRAEQYVAGGYGTAEFRSMSQAPKSFLVCLCGRPTFPQAGTFAHGTTAGIAEKDFQESQKSALEVIKSHSLVNFAQMAASPSEVAELRNQIEGLKITLGQLTTKEYAAELKSKKFELNPVVPIKAARRPRAKSAEAREEQTNGDKA